MRACVNRHRHSATVFKDSKPSLFSQQRTKFKGHRFQVEFKGQHDLQRIAAYMLKGAQNCAAELALVRRAKWNFATHSNGSNLLTKSKIPDMSVQLANLLTIGLSKPTITCHIGRNIASVVHAKDERLKSPPPTEPFDCKGHREV